MEDLEDIVNDLSIGGKYFLFYTELQELIESTYSESRIKGMRDTLVYVSPHRKEEVNSYDKMKVLFEYSQLI